jgi:hypothetical protein
MSNEMTDVIAVTRGLHLWKVTLPDEVNAVLATWKVLTDRRAQARGSAVDDLRVAAQRGQLTADTAAARVEEVALDVLARERAAAVIGDLEAPLAARACGALREHGDELVEGLRPHFDQAAAKLTAAAALVPSGSDAAVAVARGDDAVRAWRELGEAGAALDALATVRAQLVAVGYGAYDPAPASLVIARFASRDEMAAANGIMVGRDPRSRTEQGGRWRLLLDLGLTPRLNTATEARDVERAANATPVMAGRRG